MSTATIIPRGFRPVVAAPNTGNTDPVPWYELDIDQFADTQAFLNAHDGSVFTAEDPTHWSDGAGGVGKIEIVVDAPSGIGTKSMRYKYDNANPDVVMDIGSNVPLPADVQEVWVEAYIKWSANFSTVGGTAPYDHKVLFGRNRQSGRWDFKVGADSGLTVNGTWPGGVYTSLGVTSSSFWTGQWLRLRFHWKFGTAANGAYEFWLDDTKKFSNTAITTTVGAMYGLALGRNQDNRNVSNLPMYMYWGRTRAWNTDPGWV